MHSLASSLPAIPPRRVPAPRCTITRSRPPTPLNPPTVTLAPEPWIRGAIFHTPPDHPNSPIRAGRLSRKPQIGARIRPNRVHRRRLGIRLENLGIRGSGQRPGVGVGFGLDLRWGELGEKKKLAIWEEREGDCEERDGYMEHGRDDERDWGRGSDAGVLGRGKRGHSRHFARIEAFVRARAAAGRGSSC